MPNKNTEKSEFQAGMYLLETLSSGMYNDPLTIYREYIQNAVDSIDLVDRRKALSVKIDLDTTNRKVTFYDNGAGIEAKEAKKILSAIGSSNKIDKGMRGFRGIGRLGGLAFCEKATFRTKAYNETVESVQEWDCKRLRSMLSKNNQSTGTLKMLFDESTNFYQLNSKKSNQSYFVVELEGVASFRNYIFDLKRVYDYLAKIAPVPFDPDRFGFGGAITNYVCRKVVDFATYDIFLNGRQIFKPYGNFISVTNKSIDNIYSIEFIDIIKDKELIGAGWYGQRENFIGAISKGDRTSGVRVRLGNILIGDEHLLDDCFREVRFNSYLIGEIHINSKHLIPNSRRDDFIDNSYKTFFYNEVSKKIGLPLSKQIREKSRLYSEKQKKLNIKTFDKHQIETKPDDILLVINKSQISKIKEVDSLITNKSSFDKPVTIRHNISIAELKNVLKSNCKECPTIKQILNFLEKNDIFPI